MASKSAWNDFVKDNLASYQKKYGNRGIAMKQLGQEWKAKKGTSVVALLEKTKELKIDGELSPNGNNGANEPTKELKAALQAGSIENAFKQHHQTSAVDYLVNPGPTLDDMAMRVYIPNQRPESMRFVVAAMETYYKCLEFHDFIGAAQVKSQIALMCSMDGYSRNQLVQAIIGEGKGSNSVKGFGDWLEKAAFGKKKKENPEPELD